MVRVLPVAAYAWMVLTITISPVRLSAAEDAEHEILAIEQQMTAAWNRQDADRIAMLVADEFESWSYRGERRTKADLLRQVRRSSAAETTVTQAKVRVYGKAAVYTAKITDRERAADGSVSLVETCVTDVFVLRKGKWRMVASHETLLPASTR